MAASPPVSRRAAITSAPSITSMPNPSRAGARPATSESTGTSRSHREAQILTIGDHANRHVALGVGLDGAPADREGLRLHVGRERARSAEYDLARAELLRGAGDREEWIVRRQHERHHALPVPLREVDD